MASAELKRSWEVTTGHLQAARALLPSAPAPGADGGSVVEYQSFIEHNELELALDELADVGAANRVVPQFWRSLAKAAENMGLTDKARQIQQKAEAS
jgi:hypothetical protein